MSLILYKLRKSVPRWPIKFLVILFLKVDNKHIEKSEEEEISFIPFSLW